MLDEIQNCFYGQTVKMQLITDPVLPAVFAIFWYATFLHVGNDEGVELLRLSKADKWWN